MGKRQREGRRVRSLCGMNYLAPFLMRTRGDSTNFYEDRVEVTKADEFIRAKKQAGYQDYNMMYLLLAAYVRTVARYPEVNRYIKGQRIYARNSIEMVLTIKMTMETNAPETVLKVTFPPDATAEQVYHLLHDQIDIARQGDTSFDDIVGKLVHVPRIFLRGFVQFLYFIDYFFGLPRSLSSVSPFHGSVAITSMGSLRIQPVFHHLYNFGNIPVFCAFGNGYVTHVTNEEGELVRKKYVDLKFSLDERITDGFGYATVFHYLKYILQNPGMLDSPPEKVYQDID